MPQSHKTQQLVSQQLQVLHAGLACPSLFNLNNTTPSIFTPRGLWLQNKVRPLVSPQMLFETPSIPPLKSHLLICISRTLMTKSNHEITCHHMTEKSLRSKLLVAGHSGWRTGNCKAKHSTKDTVSHPNNWVFKLMVLLLTATELSPYQNTHLQEDPSLQTAPTWRYPSSISWSVSCSSF